MRSSVLALSLLLLTSCTNAPSAKGTLEGSPDPTLSSKHEIISRLLGDAPNFAQTANGRFSAVVSRGYGRGAKAGALIEFFYPCYAQDHLWDAYNGLSYEGHQTWFHDLVLRDQSVLEDTGIIRSEFATKDGKLLISTEDVALADSDTLVRHVEIKNRSASAIPDLKLFFYECFTLHYTGLGDDLRFDPSGFLLHSEKDLAVAIGASTRPDSWQCGQIQGLLGREIDARRDAEDGSLRENPSAHATVGLGVNGTLRHSLGTLASGQTLKLDYFLSAGKSPEEAKLAFARTKTRPWSAIVAAERATWQAWLSRAKMPAMDERTRRVYRRALITMKQDTAENGAVLAAPTLLSPVYSFCWPRDGAIAAEAYLAAGYPEEAKKFVDWICQRQKPSGGWAVNFFLDGSRPLWDFGDRKNEHDEVGTVVWIIGKVFDRSKDTAWLREKWPVVQKACDFLIRYQGKNGLMEPCRDLWELHTDKSWTFTNAAACAGLRAGARIAKTLGEPSTTYEKAADTLEASIEKLLWKDNYYLRGLSPEGEADRKVEAANLGLCYPFEVFPADSPRMKAMADRIARDLASPRSGIRRYTGDRYYDGQPWPATTDWLAIAYQRAGQREKARLVHRTITDYAFTTHSLMLGEQFDEEKSLWVSAFPLTWSEAKYVLATLELY